MFFLKKRTKKLLSIWAGRAGQVPAKTNEVFLLLFLQKKKTPFIYRYS